MNYYIPTNCGLSVVSARNAEEALEKARYYTPTMAGKFRLSDIEKTSKRPTIIVNL